MRQSALAVSVIIAILISATANAHPLKKWGVKAGFTSAIQIWEHDFISDENLTRRSGFHVGIFTEWFDYRNLSVVLGLNYEQKGTGFTNLMSDISGMLRGEETLYSRSDYLSIPILAKYTIRGENVSPYIVGGPRVDIFLGYAKDKGDLVWGIEDEWRDVVFGLSGGLGVELKTFASRSLFVEFVYNYDPLWLYEFTNMLTGNEQRVKNESFNLSVGLGF